MHFQSSVTFIVAMIVSAATTVSGAAAAANDSSLSIRVHGPCTCLQSYIAAIYNRIFRGFVHRSCRKQHTIASIVTAVSSKAAVANDNHNSDYLYVSCACTSEASGAHFFRTSLDCFSTKVHITPRDMEMCSEHSNFGPLDTTEFRRGTL